MSMRVLTRLLLATSLFLPAASAMAAEERPRLVLTIVVDQMRYDYLQRFGAEFSGGLKRLLEEGAVFTNAHYEAAPTVTAVGHATILSGATPSVSGIPGNAFYDRAAGRQVQSITDVDVSALGEEGTGASPRRLAVSTVGDELKLSGHGGKVFGVSMKDRSAILPAGRAADAAYWFGDRGNIVSSTWYFPALPQWVQDYNATQPAARFGGVEWAGLQLPALNDEDFYARLDETALADELVLEFALLLMEQEDLGSDAATDLLSVSFSATDYLGHSHGIDVPQMRAMMLSVDEKIGRLIDAAQQRAGRNALLVVLTADHGVARRPEDNAADGLPGGRYEARDERRAVEEALDAAFGTGDYVIGSGEMSMYLSRAPHAAAVADGATPPAPVSRAAMEQVAAATLRQLPKVARVYTRTELESPLFGGDRIDQRVRNGFNALGSGDVIVVHEPGWMNRPAGTTHGSPWAYDSHVPLIFWGPGSLVEPGRYHGVVAIHDIAATLATLLNIALPSGSMGRTLDEMLP
ncbi:MAG: hypothetical protein RL572_1408 [Pseudomonadota bacterium]